jgi:hypothetical protein
MSTREERAAGMLTSGEMNGRRFAEHIGVAHGTIKRWLHEGMPARRDKDDHGVWITPADAQAWIAQRFNGRRTVAFNRRAIIYVAQREEDGAVKIGWTSDIMRRMRELQKETGCAVELVGCVPGDKPLEGALHRHFASARVDGEWFLVEVEDVLRTAVDLRDKAAA